MSEKLEPILGTSDIWEPEISAWRVLENTARDVFRRYAYSEVRTPIFERTDVFTRGIGTETDVVRKEMYTFEDRGGRSLTLRPEGTAGVMRAIINQGLAEGEEKRVFYMGPMFRGERPAAGRRRQFHQIGVEAVGKASPGMDVECIAMLQHYLTALGIPDGKLLLNSRGTATDRPAVAAALKDYFAPQIAGMCEDCRRRFDGNVWRILDCKLEPCQGPIAGAPRMVDLLSAESQAFFAAVCHGLDDLGVAYQVDPRLVRGLDYYEHTVFEITHGGLGAQNAIAGGGRYAIGLPGLNKPVEGVGFAAGMERLLMARESRGVQTTPEAPVEIYIASLGPAAVAAALPLAQSLRAKGCCVLAETVSRSVKAQMRTANKCGARVALIRGDSELQNGTVACKNMADATQQDVPLAELDAILAKVLGRPL